MISELCLCKQLRAGAAACGRSKVWQFDEACVNPRALGNSLPRAERRNKSSCNLDDKGGISLPYLHPRQTPPSLPSFEE